MKKRRCNRSCFSDEEEKVIGESIPIDLVIEILVRSPVKSVARFRCVSKLWDSLMDRPDFTESLYTISLSRPKLLFSCLKDGKTFFLSSSKPQGSSRLAAVKIHMSFPINRPLEIFRPVRGLVCGLNQHSTSKQGTVNVPLICNPSTGETLALPKLKTKRKRGVTSYLGYDPIGKQFKVLCMTHTHDRPYFYPHEVEVLTLGTDNPSWTKIQCNIRHERVVLDGNGHSAYDGICINGALYYLAYLLDEHTTGVVCFDFRSEKFKCIRFTHDMGRAYSTQSTLVNYKGILALLLPNRVNGMPSPGIQLWVLENAETHQWFSYIYLWPPPRPHRKKIVAKTKFGQKLHQNIKLRIQGMEAFKEHIAYTFLDHVEDLRQVSRIVGS
ncbi:F-box protein At3g61340-like [Capsella rubella]|uniref:F-box protein At3g61340-like n=1 Tax=Capsella rubella TaxID=81985 RepID=UPI000CD51081|nr:F-box protein At3g61340-like [Capsella rubella]